MILLETITQHGHQQQRWRSNVVGSESLLKCFSAGDISSLRDMGEHFNTVSSLSNCKTNSVHVSSFQKAYETSNDLTIPSRVDTSGIKSTDRSITVSAAIDDKPIANIKKKKKKKKKGKKNSNISHCLIDLTGPKECDQHIRTSFVSSNLDNRLIDCDKKCRLVPPADNISVCACETIGGCLEDATSCNRNLTTGCLGCEPLEVAGNFVHSDFRTNNDATLICGGDLQKTSRKGGESETSEKKIVMHCSNRCIEGFKEDIFLVDLPEYMPCGTDSTMSATSEDSNGDGTDRTQPRSQKVCFSDAYAVYPSGRHNAHSRSDVNKTRCQHNIQTGKENSHLVWQKNKKCLRDAHAYGCKTSDHVYVPKDTNSLVKDDSFSSHGLLPTPAVTSARRHSSANQMKNKQGLYRGTHCNVLVESSQGIDQHSEVARQEIPIGRGNLKEIRNLSCKHDNLIASNKRTADCKPSMFRCQSRPGLSQNEAFQNPEQFHRYNKRCFTQRGVNHDHWTQLNRSHCSQSHLQMNSSMKIPRTEHVFVDSLQASINKLKRNPFCFATRNSYEDIRQDLPSRVSFQKWIPVGRKDSEVLKSFGAVCDSSSVEEVPKSSNENAELHIENIVPVAISAVDPEKTCLASSHERPKLASDIAPPCHITNDTSIPFIGSQIVTKALNAAYQLQIVSDSIQLATGSPLAEFEKLLQLSSPVIVPSFALQHCDVCLGNQLPCKHQLANIPLRDVWDWYEKPGNYGLEVRAEDTENRKENDASSSSFTAHFVPFLSAIQLFRHSQISENGESMDDNMELVFEFFEHDQPQQRKPLYHRVRDMIKLQNSDHHVFGDPSRLDSTDLCNIHPASWYSVAWYPIYRVPEGIFRASFLTYHSLGYLVQRCNPAAQSESQFCVVSPALGLQSYNTQGECWFHPKSSSQGVLPFDSSEFLKERMRTLEETALRLARGCVYKDQVRVTNRQPDYEFFLSRKR